MERSRRLLVALVALVALACSAPAPSPAPLRLALMMPFPEGVPALPPDVSLALERVNAAGGVAGRPLAIDRFDTRGMPGEEADALGARLAEDPTYLAVLGVGNSRAVFGVADAFVQSRKPIVSFLSAAADVLRAYSRRGVVWRTRESDVAQTELLVRFAREQRAERLALVVSLDTEGMTFFNWFGFFAEELRYPRGAVTISAVDANEPRCGAAVDRALAASPELLFVAVGNPEQLRCVVDRASAARGGRAAPRIVLADTGLDRSVFAGMPGGLEGFSVGADPAYAQDVRAHRGAEPGPHGAAAYDAVLLLAYGLQASRGRGGQALIDALKSVVEGRDAGPYGWTRAGIAATLAALAAGRHPDVTGASTALDYEPELYVDPASSTLAHWTLTREGFTEDRRYDTGAPEFLTSAGALVPPSQARRPPIAEGAWEPAAARTDAWAVIAVLSQGWDNYRHQADALRQYQALRANGVDDDHIVLITPDDAAGDPRNRRPGTVRNAPAGPDLRASARVDYRAGLTSADLASVIAGRATASAPSVPRLSASSDLYVYLVGHGGRGGIPVAAATAAQGVDGAGDVFSPAQLREALCALRRENRVRRALVVIESCFAGAFGDRDLGGIEQGCGAADGPLGGVVLVTAANDNEVSYADAYDPELGVWVTDAFSDAFAARATAGPATGLVQLYADVYVRVSGSHATLYNAAAAGRITGVTIGEFLAP